MKRRKFLKRCCDNPFCRKLYCVMSGGTTTVDGIVLEVCIACWQKAQMSSQK